MPAIIRCTCSACAFERTGIESSVTVIGDDGKEHVCPHPVEKSRARGWTGRSWAFLVAADRVRVNCGLLCLGCGHLGYYPMKRVGDGSGRHVTSLYYRPSLQEVVRYACQECQQHQLYPLCGPQIGCATLILGLLRGKRRQLDVIPCPHCQQGTLRFAGIAIC